MRKMLFIAIFCLASVAFLTGGAWGVVEHCVVDESGLLTALTTAVSNGDDDIIKVEQGTYTGNFAFDSDEGHNIAVLGGYTSGCSGRVVDPANTVLDADGSGLVLFLLNSDGGDVLVEGLTIRNGNRGVSAQATSSTGGSGNVTLMHNTVTENTGGGSALYAYSYSSAGTSGNINLEENTISENSASYNVNVTSYSDSYTSGTITITGNTITRNTAGAPGGGVVAYSGSGSSGDSGNITLSNNTITGNSAGGYGGGVYAHTYVSGDMVTGGDITLTNNIIRGNTTAGDYTYGGGLYAMTYASFGSGTSGSITLTDNTIIGNTVQGEEYATGGGVRAGTSSDTGPSGAIFMMNNTIIGNAARGPLNYTYGGGVNVSSHSSSGTAGNLSLSNNTVKENYSAWDSGGVLAYSSTSSGTSGAVILTDNNITGNRAETQYGGVYANSGTADVALTNNTISDNSAPYVGGAYVDAGDGDIMMINNIITGNNGSSGLGGGLCLGGTLGTRTLINNTVARNSAYNTGGVAVWKDDTTFNCYNNIMWGNTDSALAGDIAFLGTGTGTMNGFNNNYADMYGTWNNGGGTNINVDPKFVDPDNGDFRLQSDSLCKDAGTTISVPSPGLPSTDFEGDARQIDTNVDIGADEVSIVTTCVSTATGLQNALTAAVSNSKDDVIMVQEGLYTRTGNFVYNSSQGHSITLLGGYESGCAGRVIDPANTVLYSTGSGSVLNLYNDTNGGNITVGGFSIQNGVATGFGGGVRATSDSDSGQAGDVTLMDNIITGNTATTGGGVFASSNADTGQSGAVTLADNIITGNTSNDQGGGVYASSYGATGSDDVILTGNTIIENTAINYGGGASVIAGATSGQTGAVTLINNIVAENSVSYASGKGGGVFVWPSSGSGPSDTVTLTNNTVTENAAVQFGGGVYIVMDDNINNCYNNIIWGNTTPMGLGGDIELTGTGTAHGHNNVYSHLSGSWATVGNNLNVNPLFVDVTDPNPADWDLHLRSNSPCIDAGTASAPGLPIDDFEGDPRIVNGTPEIGADEALVISPSASSSRLCPNGLGFGPVETSSSRNLNLVMNNTTDEDIDVGTVSTPAGPFSKPSDNCDSITLHPGDTCSITIQFAPSSTGTFYDSFDIPTDDPEAGTITVALSGMGVTGGSFETRGSTISGPGATVIPDMTVTDTVDVTPASPPVIEGPASTPSSAGTTPAGAPEQTSGDTGTTPSASAPVTISSLPPSIQRDSEKQLLLAEELEPYDVMVFGEVNVGASDQLRIIFSHEQGTAIKVGDIILPTEPYLIVEDTCSGTELGAGGECKVTVQFAPPSTQNFYDYFLIPTDDPEIGTLRINLEGRGISE